MFTKDYVKDIFAEKKQLLRKKDVLFIDFPKFDELSVKNLYNALMALEGMQRYFPDKYPKGRQCDRDYLFNVANTMHPGVVQEYIEFALKQRNDPELSGNKHESILVSDKWKEELQSLPLSNKVSILQHLSPHRTEMLIFIFSIELSVFSIAATQIGLK